MASARTWTALPNEMKLAIIASLDQNGPLGLKDIHALSLVNCVTYSLCIPYIFRKIQLRSDNAICNFLANVSAGHYKYIRDLDICNQPEGELRDVEERSKDLVRILELSTGLQRLDLKLTGSPSVEIISPFKELQDLRTLNITNCSREEHAPLSERLVVSIALTVPHLQSLTLERVSRSIIHAPELTGASQCVPFVTNDSNVPNHPDEIPLSLPSLLQISSLRSLKIQDTHLGDPRWQNSNVHVHVAQLDTLELGGCVYESDEFNRLCAERILFSVGSTVSHFSLSIPLASATTSTSGVLSPVLPTGSFFATMPVPPMQKLKKLNISAALPVDDLVSTLATSTLSGSPIESLEVECLECDKEDVCDVLEEFLALRAEQGPQMFFQALKHIRVFTHDKTEVVFHDLQATFEVQN